MNRLQGYGDNGYNYRRAAIERNNSSRLKWMMSEAKKSAEIREKNEGKENNSFSTIDSENTNNTSDLTNTTKPIDSKNEDKMFRPNEVNRFSRGNSFFKKN